MDVQSVPAALRDRLGVEAAAGLASLFDTARRDWVAVTELAVERFERRLTEEVSGIRVEMANGHASLREEIARGHASLREEIARGQATLREEMAAMQSAIRKDMVEGQAALRKDMDEGLIGIRQELATTRVDLFKWGFLFWIGQVATMTAILSAMLRR